MLQTIKVGNIRVRGQHMSAGGELGEVGRAQVNRWAETIHDVEDVQSKFKVRLTSSCITTLINTLRR